MTTKKRSRGDGFWRARPTWWHRFGEGYRLSTLRSHEGTVVEIMPEGDGWTVLIRNIETRGGRGKK